MAVQVREVARESRRRAQKRLARTAPIENHPGAVWPIGQLEEVWQAVTVEVDNLEMPAGSGLVGTEAGGRAQVLGLSQYGLCHLSRLCRLLRDRDQDGCHHRGQTQNLFHAECS